MMMMMMMTTTLDESFNDVVLLNKSSQSYEASLAIWDHTALPSTRHK